jgi:hypothetical protein
VSAPGLAPGQKINTRHTAGRILHIRHAIDVYRRSCRFCRDFGNGSEKHICLAVRACARLGHGLFLSGMVCLSGMVSFSVMVSFSRERCSKTRERERRKWKGVEFIRKYTPCACQRTHNRTLACRQLPSIKAPTKALFLLLLVVYTRSVTDQVSFFTLEVGRTRTQSAHKLHVTQKPGTDGNCRDECCKYNHQGILIGASFLINALSLSVSRSLSHTNARTRQR